MFKATHGSKPAEPWFKAGPGCDTVPGVHSEAITHHSKNFLCLLWRAMAKPSNDGLVHIL